MPTTKKDHMPILDYIEAGHDLRDAVDDSGGGRSPGRWWP